MVKLHDGRINIGKIAGLQTLAHEQGRSFWEGQIDRDNRARSSTKGLLSCGYKRPCDFSLGICVGDVVFHRIHDQFEAVFDFELAINRGEVIAQRVFAHVQMNCDLLIC